MRRASLRAFHAAGPHRVPSSREEPREFPTASANPLCSPGPARPSPRHRGHCGAAARGSRPRSSLPSEPRQLARHRPSSAEKADSGFPGCKRVQECVPPPDGREGALGDRRCLRPAPRHSSEGKRDPRAKGSRPDARRRAPGTPHLTVSSAGAPQGPVIWCASSLSPWGEKCFSFEIPQSFFCREEGGKGAKFRKLD